jgi:type I restriction enzyme S subunit
VSAIPETWQLISLGEETKCSKGKKPRVLESLPSSNFLPYIDIKAFERGIVDKYAAHDGGVLAEATDTLMVWDGARSGLVGNGIKGILGSTLMRVIPLISERVYFHYFLKYQFEFINSNTKGTGIPHVDPAKLWAIEYPMPPINEQIRISKKLDNLLTKVDTAQARLEKIPILLKRFRQSVLTSATTGELTTDWRAVHSAKNWNEVVLLDVIEQKPRNGTSPKGVDFETPIKNLTLSSITSGKFIDGKFKYVDLEVPESSYLWVKNEDILIQRANSIDYVGVSAIYKGKDNLYIYPDLIMKCRANAKADPMYIYYSLSSERIRKYFRDNATGTSGNMPKINQATVSSTPISLPELKEQKEIVRRVESLFALAEVVEKQYCEAKRRVDRLTRSLLAKAFRGELVPQDPNDEPATELLKRIQAEREAQSARKPERKTATPKQIIKTRKNTLNMTLDNTSANYLIELLTQLGDEAHAEVLWKKSELSIDDFYARLKKNIKSGSIVDDNSSADPSLRKLKIAQSETDKRTKRTR